MSTVTYDQDAERLRKQINRLRKMVTAVALTIPIVPIKGGDMVVAGQFSYDNHPFAQRRHAKEDADELLAELVGAGCDATIHDDYRPSMAFYGWARGTVTVKANVATWMRSVLYEQKQAAADKRPATAVSATTNQEHHEPPQHHPRPR